VVLHGISDPDQRKKTIRKEQVRWHPDRWAGRKARIKPSAFERVMAKVTEISKLFNALAESDAA
jgi:hypothetical protein